MKKIAKTCHKCQKTLEETGGKRLSLMKYFPEDSDTLYWECQICAGRVCEKCEQLHDYLAGRDIIYDNGEIRHVAILPIGSACFNKACRGR